jgi:mono/diheme cytochrome c family protein
MKNISRTFIVISFSAVFYLGASSLPTDKSKALAPPTYQRDIKPIIEAHCLSCHGPRKSANRELATYEAVSSKIEDILYRVQLPSNNRNFMPYKLRQPPLSKAQINLLKAWEAGGLLEK